MNRKAVSGAEMRCCEAAAEAAAFRDVRFACSGAAAFLLCLPKDSRTASEHGNSISTVRNIGQ